ncbi:hypothetical protein TNCV_1599541 [Trichonephila clavipes]|nr:hypothetical protein TNCV_1599541 [Trichonephila clavipes]
MRVNSAMAQSSHVTIVWIFVECSAPQTSSSLLDRDSTCDGGFIAPFTKSLLGNLWVQNSIFCQPTQEENAICRLGMIMYIGAVVFAEKARRVLEKLRGVLEV